MTGKVSPKSGIQWDRNLMNQALKRSDPKAF